MPDLIVDRVPVDVTLPTGERFLHARLFATATELQVWVEGNPPRLAYSTPLTELNPAGQTYVTPDGDLVTRRSFGVCTCSLPGLMSLRWTDGGVS